jgi:hypothetical protein
VKDENPRTKLEQADFASYIPSKKLFMVVDKAAVIRNKVVAPEDYDKIADTLEIDLSSKHYITKDELMILDMLANNNWKRPIYFAITVGRDKYMNLQDYFQLEGLAYKLVPIKTAPAGINFGKVNSGLMYTNVMENFKWGNMEKPGVYIDENNGRMMMNIRNTFNRLAETFVAEGNNEKAAKVLDRCVELIPHKIVPYNYFSMMMSETYFKAGQPAKGKEIINTIMSNYKEQLDYFFKLDRQKRNTVDEDIQRSLYFMREISMICTQNKQPELLNEVSATFNSYFERYSSLK